MKALLNWLFGKRKDGHCRWWQHEKTKPEIVRFQAYAGTKDGKSVYETLCRSRKYCIKCHKVWLGKIKPIIK